MPAFLQPLVQSFVVCDEIYESPRRKFLLFNPFNTSTCIGFPASVLVSIYADLTDARGRYSMGLQLVDDEGDVVWSYESKTVLEEPDPLRPHRFILRDIALMYPTAGRYDLTILANGVPLAHHALWARYP